MTFGVVLLTPPPCSHQRRQANVDPCLESTPGQHARMDGGRRGQNESLIWYMAQPLCLSACFDGTLLLSCCACRVLRVRVSVEERRIAG